MKAYKRHQFPSEIIPHAVPKVPLGQAPWLYYRFNR